jgi:copper transport protein
VSRRLHRIAAALLAPLLFGVALPAAASAHATLEGTTPGRGAIARTPPRAVTLRFDESVEGAFGAVRVYDAAGARVDDGRVTHPGGRGALLAVGLKPGLRDGTYTATYRVISADSHPVSGGFVFSVGHAGAAPAATVGELLGKNAAGTATEVALGVARGATYLAIAVVLGTLLFGLLAWRGAGDAGAEVAFDRRRRALLFGGIGLGLVAGAVGIVGQGAVAGGTSFWSALDPDVVREVLHTRFGTVWALRLADLVLLAAVLLAFGVRRPAAWALPAAFLAVTPALAGHATTQHPVAVLAPLDVVHVLAMSAWVGGLVVLVAAVPAATRAIREPAARTPVLAGTLSRFSVVALAAVAALLATGVAQSLFHLTAVDDLWDTAFGRAIAIKVALLAALIGLGALNRQRSIPRLRAAARDGATAGAAGRVLRSTLRAEVALVTVVLGVTAALVSYAPPDALSAGPFSKTTRTGPLEVQLTIDPARTGPNAAHVYVFRASDGAPLAATKELTLRAALPGKGIGPLTATVHRAGPGHYVADALTLSPAGTWTVDATVRVSDFDEYTTKMQVRVR